MPAKSYCTTAASDQLNRACVVDLEKKIRIFVFCFGVKMRKNWAMAATFYDEATSRKFDEMSPERE